MNTYNPKIIIFLIVFIIPLTGASIDLHVPSLPFIQRYFHTSETMVQASISIYLLGYSVGQLVIGTLSDCFGRRRILLAGTFVYLLACLATPWMPSMKGVLLLRLIQGLAVAGPGVVTKALVGDCFSGEALRKASNYLTIAWAGGPILAPMVGGYLQHYLGWQSCFYFLSGYAFFILLFAFWLLPETKNERVPFRPKAIASTYLSILKHKVFLAGFIIIAFGYSLMTSFNVAGPFLIQKTLHFSAIGFGHCALVLGIAWFIGNLLNRALLKHYENEKILTWVTSCMVATMLVTLGLMSFMSSSLSLYSLMVPTFIMFILGGLLMPNCFALVMSTFPKLGGTVNALMGTLFVLISSGVSFIASQFPTTTALPLMLLYGVISLVCTSAFFVALRHR